MKKLTLAFLCLLVTLVGCNSDEHLPSGGSKPTTKSTFQWYGVKRASEAPMTRGVAQNLNLWPQNQEVTIKFLNQPADLGMLDKIKTYAKEWEEHANIKFRYVEESEKALVRIAFDQDNEWLTWSYTGSEARVIRNQADPTANFGGLNEDELTEEEIKGAVLRVFGQILGLEYEQRHFGWDESWWKKDKKGNYMAQLYWESEFMDYYEDFDWETIKEYVFDPLQGKGITQSDDIDLKSIMLYPYSAKEATVRSTNYVLSAGDKEFIARLYPKAQIELPTIQEAWVDAGLFEWTNEEKTWVQITDLGREQSYLPDVRDGEQLTSAYEMFYKADKLKKAPMFNSSNVADFSHFLLGASLLAEVPLYDTSSGTIFRYMFSACSSLTHIPDIQLSNGIDFSYMFNRCESLESLGYLDTRKGVLLDGMFNRCTKLQSIEFLDLSSFTDYSHALFDLSVFSQEFVKIHIKGVGQSAMETSSYFDIPSFALGVESIQYMVDNTTGSISARPLLIQLYKDLESKLSASLIAEAKAKNIEFSFYDIENGNPVPYP